MVEPAEVVPLRKVQTVYRRRQKIVRINMAKHPEKAVLHCLDHMQFNDYGATNAEVTDTITGEVYAVVTHSVVGEIKILLKKEFKRKGK